MAKRPIHRLSSNGTKAEFDELADEVIITILDQDKTIVRILGTPLDLPDLAIGHIVAEGEAVSTAYVFKGIRTCFWRNCTKANRRPVNCIMWGMLNRADRVNEAFMSKTQSN